MNLPAEFLTAASLGTLAGLSLVVYLLVEVFRVYLARIEGIIPIKTVASLLGMVLSLILAVSGSEAMTPVLVILSIANGAMAGLAATGGAAVISEAAKRFGNRGAEGVAAAGADPVLPPQRARWGQKW